MITTETAREMTDAALFFARMDLTATIRVQDQTVRLHGTNAAPKLGQYLDELHVIAGEIKRRQDVR